MENDNKFLYSKSYIFKHSLLSLARKDRHIYENYVNQLDNCKYARILNEKYTLKDLFVNYWDIFKERHKSRLTRACVIESVEKMLHCKDLSRGYLFFECTKCNNFHVQGFSCHSRFCSSCGQKYRDERTIEVEKKLLSVSHRQFVFTIAKELRVFFLKYRGMLDLLFLSVDEVFKGLMRKSKTKTSITGTLGYIEFLHTFGRDLKWNPHIHVLFAERILDKEGNIEKLEYFSYKRLRKSFMTILLRNMTRYLKKHCTHDDNIKFNLVKKYLYIKYTNGFYVYGPKLKNSNKSSVKNLAKYIARYASHPAIAQDRILKIDFDNRLVTWYYDPHEDDDLNKRDRNYKGRQFITESFDNFISKLLPHIPDKGFQQIRYYGFYSNKSKINISKYTRLFSTKEIIEAKNSNTWINKLLSSYSYSPLLCTCGEKMTLNIHLSYFGSKYG